MSAQIIEFPRTQRNDQTLNDMIDDESLQADTPNMTKLECLALEIREYKRDFEQAWEKVDAILTPTTPGPAFGIGEKSDDPLEMYLNDIFTVTANMSGLPGISVPAGLSDDGLPLGLQVIGKALDEETVFRVGGVIEEAAQFTAQPDVWWR